MTFILRIVLILIVFSFVVYIFKAIARIRFNLSGTIKEVRKLREQLSGRPATAGAEMVRCASCGAFVSSRDALVVSSRNLTQSFCSPECIRSHALK